MKVCLNCQTENPPDAAVCSECGMSFRQSPTAEVTQRTKELAEQWRSRAEEAPSASGIVFLFLGRILQESGPLTLLYRGTKAGPEDRAGQFLLSAFVQLATEGYLQLDRVENEQLGPLSGPDVRAVRSGEPRGLLHGLEAAIWQNISDDPDGDPVTLVISRIVSAKRLEWGRTGGGMRMDDRRQRGFYSLKIMMGKVVEGLLEQGHLVVAAEGRWLESRRRHLSGYEALIAAHESKVDELNAMLASFEASDPALYKQLVESVKRGISASHKAWSGAGRHPALHKELVEWVITASRAEQALVEVKDAPSASGIVYLFGDRFVGKTRFDGETLVYGGTKVKHNELANQLVLSVFVQLASEGYLQMERVERKKLGLLTERDVQVTRANRPKEPLHGLESAVWDNIADDPVKDRVSEIIKRMFGHNRVHPKGYIVDWAKEELLEQGYLATENEVGWSRVSGPTLQVHWFANEDLIAPHEGKVDEVKAMLASFEAADPTLYRQLVKSIDEGIGSRLSDDY